MDRLFNFLHNVLYRHADGPTDPFADVPVPDPGTGLSAPVPEPPAALGEGLGAAGGDLTGFTDRPGAGRHANGCDLLDDPRHICEDWHGNPTSRMCRQSIYRRAESEFDRDHPGVFGPVRASGCAYSWDAGHRCVNESGQPSTLTCHATYVRRQTLGVAS